MLLKLLVSPLAKGAYFADYLEVARAELLTHFPGHQVTVEQRGGLDFLCLDLDVETERTCLRTLARLSFVQGVFQAAGCLGDALAVVDTDSELELPEELVYGSKYRGKTNELVTQLAINLGLHYARIDPAASATSLLDPMAGRGTTLLWALRYGMNAKGIEQDRSALSSLHLHLKKQAKLHRIPHRQSQGSIGKRNKEGRGKFVQYEFGQRALQLIAGDSLDTSALVARQRFDLLVTDLPYGIQHKGDSGRRNPLQTISACASSWVDSVRTGGAVVLIFNRYQPRREDLIEIFTDRGCRLEPFTAPHRMSESIVRDLVVLTKPAAD